MKVQLERIFLGTFFILLAVWGTFLRGMPVGSFLVAYILGALLLIRTLPLPWERWQEQPRPPQD